MINNNNFCSQMYNLLINTSMKDENTKFNPRRCKKYEKNIFDR